jgi:CRP-like cAMP-binding protein
MNIPPSLAILYQSLQKFESLPPPHEFAAVLPFIKRRKAKKGEHLLQAGEICTELYFIISGAMRTYYKTPSSTESTYSFAFENMFFSEQVSLVSQKPSGDFIEVIEDSDFFCIKYQDLLSLYKTYHSWEHIGRVMSDHFFSDERIRLRSVMNEDAATRYRKLIQHIPQVHERLPKYIIASYLGITPQSLSRLLRKELSDI